MINTWDIMMVSIIIENNWLPSAKPQRLNHKMLCLKRNLLNLKNFSPWNFPVIRYVLLSFNLIVMSLQLQIGLLDVLFSVKLSSFFILQLDTTEFCSLHCQLLLIHMAAHLTLSWLFLDHDLSAVLWSFLPLRTWDF